MYRIDYDGAKLIPLHDERAQPGCGPRHIAFHPALPLVYVNSEQDSTVHSYRFDFETGALAHADRALTISQPYIPPDPTDHFAKNETADIRIHKSGKFLYVSNRGHNSIAVFGLDDRGHIAPSGRVPSGGEIPRAIQFDLSGDLLYAINQRTGEVANAADSGQQQMKAGTRFNGGVAAAVELPQSACKLAQSAI